ncbi:MAG TPA: prephenate dehydrogenase/arogenate dehydrogenase family protein [Solirubrobacterales bacterium]|nr:prephenate dehydrogenase/arogenate dehydrogenase family protein [Solirubrobacterales bacterium]
MRIAVLGVGLIGGSIGLAAKRRLEGEVAGFDADPANAQRGRELGALDRVAGSVREAAAEAEIVFCAAPVRSLPALVAEALAECGPDAVVTDVGSTKRELLAGLPDTEAVESFIGGHPLAGAEGAGVANAREDLFEGARWYLTPTDRSGGLHYDRLQRAIADLGARPQAIDAEAHDRLMATVSHLPHVIANVLVQQAAAAAAEESERLPEIGPSFRDTTRVAGANPAIWGDIFATNREAVAREIDAVAARLAEAADLLRAGDAERLLAWHGAAREDRRRLLEADLIGGELYELRVAVENRPGTVAEIALALGRAGVNIEDMALYPAPDMRSGAISLWVAGEAEAERAADIVRGLGHAVAVSR